MKKIYATLIIMFSLVAYSETDAEIRSSVEMVKEMMTVPQDMGDGLTTLTGISTSGRGIVYTYSIGLDWDSVPPITMFARAMAKQSSIALCTDPVMTYYLINDVEISYLYYDRSGNLITLFKVTSDDC